MNLHSPFSKEALLPQEELIERQKQKGVLFIGIPKETHAQERRICLTPDAVNALCHNGQRIVLETRAGEGANYTDSAYAEAGAKIAYDVREVFRCNIVLKVAPPSLTEIAMMNPNSMLISALQLKTQTKRYFKALADKKITALAFDYIKDAYGIYPILKSLSEIAGTASVLIASEIMSSENKGAGLLCGNISGVPPTNVVILGAGTVGEFAARSAIGLGAEVKVFDNSITKLRKLQRYLPFPVYTSTIQPKTLVKALMRCDIVIGAIRGKNRAPVIVTEMMVKQMKETAVIVDVSIDRGGCFETAKVTSHSKPTFKAYGVTHYCVPNIPSRYARTASVAISNIFMPYLLHIAEKGGFENAPRFDKNLCNGIYLYRGVLTNKAIADWFDLPFRDINLLIF